MKLLITVLFITAVGLPAYDRHSAIKLGLDDWARRNNGMQSSSAASKLPSEDFDDRSLVFPRESKR
jgi:hypothetical protein